MEDFILEYIRLYGPFAVFMLLMLTGVGVPLGEEVVVIPAGAFVGSGELAFWPTVAAVYAGVLLSDAMWFFWCYRYGTRLLHKRAFKRVVHPRRLLEAKHQMEQRGAWVVVMARFVPGSRTTAITVAGLLHMPFWKFAGATAACVLITAPIQVGIGVLSSRVVGATEPVEIIRLAIALMVLATAATMLVGVWRTHKRSKRRAPRARAKWLRHFRLRRPACDATKPQVNGKA